jgi:predicted nucleic acid-binding protein
VFVCVTSHNIAHSTPHSTSQCNTIHIEFHGAAHILDSGSGSSSGGGGRIVDAIQYALWGVITIVAAGDAGGRVDAVEDIASYMLLKSVARAWVGV